MRQYFSLVKFVTYLVVSPLVGRQLIVYRKLTCQRINIEIQNFYLLAANSYLSLISSENFSSIQFRTGYLYSNKSEYDSLYLVVGQQSTVPLNII